MAGNLQLTAVRPRYHLAAPDREFVRRAAEALRGGGGGGEHQGHPFDQLPALIVKIVRVLVVGQQYGVNMADRVDAYGGVAGFD